ncbi:MAG: hypothetical protein Q9179_002634 [Wetmoreana sp. 5 TL-2023]
MAKSLRSNLKKANRARLRSQVFGPVEEARKERLSAKLLEMASKPSSAAKDDAMMLDEAAADRKCSNPMEQLDQATKSPPATRTVDDDARKLILSATCHLPEHSRWLELSNRRSYGARLFETTSFYYSNFPIAIQQATQGTPGKSTGGNGLSRFSEREGIRCPQETPAVKAHHYRSFLG